MAAQSESGSRVRSAVWGAARRIIIFGVAGVILATAVAWAGCAASACEFDEPDWKLTTELDDPFWHLWRVEQYSCFGQTRFVSRKYIILRSLIEYAGPLEPIQNLPNALPDWSSCGEHPYEVRLSTKNVKARVESAAGWPARMLHGSVDVELAGGWEGGWLVSIGDPIGAAVIAPNTLPAGPNGVGTVRLLPFIPLWGGVLLNALLFGVATWGLFATVRFARGTWRSVRGRCPACGYLLGDRRARGCPECGHGRSNDAS